MYVGHTLNTPAYRNFGVLSGALRLRVLLIHCKMKYSLLVRLVVVRFCGVSLSLFGHGVPFASTSATLRTQSMLHALVAVDVADSIYVAWQLRSQHRSLSVTAVDHGGPGARVHGLEDGLKEVQMRRK